MRRAKPISHEDELSLVEHLDELRFRVVVSLAVFGVALALCFWQNHLLLELASVPLPSNHNQLITFGISEPFTTTMTVSAYGAIILSLPIILYQLYAYLLPAFSKQQQRAILPLLLLIPALFIAGVVFGYFVVLPAATKFLLNFNDAQFNIQVQGQGVLRLLRADAARLRARLPDSGRDSRGDPPRHRQGRAADQEPPLRLPGLRGRRGGAARRRPGLDAVGDGSAAGALRAQHRPRQGLRNSRCGELRSPTRRPAVSRRLPRARRSRSCGSASPGPRRRSSPPADRGSTTELAPITQRSPTVTPVVTTQLAPNQQLAPISTGPFEVKPCSVIGFSGSSKRWLASPTKQPLANIVWSPIVTRSWAAIIVLRLRKQPAPISIRASGPSVSQQPGSSRAPSPIVRRPSSSASSTSPSTG